MATKGFKLSLYDFIGFDLDNTLCTYNLYNLITSQYKYMTEYLNLNKNHNLNQNLEQDDFQFLRRGLMMDLKNGNLIKSDINGAIFKVTHGTKILNENDIIKIYGKDKIFKPIQNIFEERKSVLKGTLHMNVYTSSDYTDIVLPLVYAKVVDSGCNEAWLDTIHALIDMYKSDKEWVQFFKNQTDFFVHKTSPKVINWLKYLKENKITGVITSSDPESANAVAEIALGPEWKNLFHFIVYNASKPYFFEHKILHETNFNLIGEYTHCSYTEIENKLNQKLGRKPKSVYFGDSILSDLQSFTDTVVICEESRVDGIFEGKHIHENILKSNLWGSFFYEGDVLTSFGETITNSNFCSPDLEYFTDFSLDHTHIPFWVKK